MQPLVSVIVPVYKVEDYLVRCLDSLCGQSLRDIEIILVDDASPDKSGVICEEYAAKDARFKVFHHSENRGLAAARNTGIANAAGDYLMFVDSDDWVHEDFCKEPYDCAVSNQADLVLFNYSIIKKCKFFKKYIRKDYKLLFDGHKTQCEAIELLLKRLDFSSWNKLYRKDLFKDISYPEGYFYEDLGTTYKLVLNAFHIYCLDKTLYYYCVRSGSITTNSNKKHLQDFAAMSLQLYHDLSVRGYSAERLDKYLIDLAMSYCIMKKGDISEPEDAFLAKTLYSCEKIPASFTWKRKVLFVLFKHCPPLFKVVCSLFGKQGC